MFVFRNTLGFKPHSRLMGPLDGINLDFGGSGTNATDINGGDNKGGNKDGDGTDPEPPSNKDGDGDGKDGDGTDGGDGKDNPDDKDGKGDDATPFTGGLEQGTNVEFEGQTYTVDANGNLVDKDNKVFKEAKDVKAWMDSLQVEEPTDEINLAAIQKALDVELTDEDGKPAEFEDSIEGIKSYVDKVIELKNNEVAQAAVNKVFTDNPILKQFVDYLTVNNGDPHGFGERPDRSSITVDEKSEEQQIAIIKTAAKEFGNASLNDNYIKYLKDSGGLYDEAKIQLANLQAADKQRDEAYAQQAEAQRQQEEAETLAYWKDIKDVITNRKIGNYTLPETLVRTVNGQKVTVTPNDFYDYLYRQTKDADGIIATAYQRDLAAKSAEQERDEELLSAWLMYTGGTYEDLVKMAINEEKVKTLKLVNKQNKGRGTVRITKPASTNHKAIDDIQFS